MTKPLLPGTVDINDVVGELLEPKPIKPKLDIDGNNYIFIPQYDVLIATEETCKEMSWEATHRELQKNGLFMPTPKIFMTYFCNVVDAVDGITELRDGNDLFDWLNEASINFKLIDTPPRARP